MTKKTKSGIFALISALLITIIMGCEIQLIEKVVVTNVSGKVVNAMTSGSTTQYWMDGSNSLSGATLSFYAQNADGTYSSTVSTTATVLSDGSYSRSNIAMGKYKIQGSKSGWAFVPRYIDITGENMTLPPVIAYPTQAANTLVILLSWEDTSLDLDGVLTYYDGVKPRDYVGNIGATDQPVMLSGTLERKRDVTASTSSSIPRVETIVIKWDTGAPYYNAAGSSTIVDTTINNNQLRYYVTNPITAGGLTGQDTPTNAKPFTNATVDIMYTNSAFVSSHYGGWDMPWNTLETTLHVLSIDSNSSDYTIKSAGNAPAIRSVSNNKWYVSVDEIK